MGKLDPVERLELQINELDKRLMIDGCPYGQLTRAESNIELENMQSKMGNLSQKLNELEPLARDACVSTQESKNLVERLEKSVRSWTLTLLVAAISILGSQILFDFFKSDQLLKLEDRINSRLSQLERIINRIINDRTITPFKKSPP